MKKYLGLTALLFLMFFLSEAQTTNLGIGSGTGGTTNVFIGKDAGKVTTAGSNSFLGFESGKANIGGRDNTFQGNISGKKNINGSYNTFIGSYSGSELLSGLGNTHMGYCAGVYAGNYNSCFGFGAGYINTGTENVLLGKYAARYNASGIKNTFVGTHTGFNNLGSNNIFIGYNAGYNELGSNKLYIDNSNTASPLIWGDFNNDRLVFNGKVGIGTSTFPATVGGVSISSYQLFVKGGILTEEVRVRSGWADYVFNDDYNLIPISELNNYISKNKHLPGVPSANDVENNGLSLGEIAKIQQEKIEELTLYLIQQNAQIEDLKNRINKIETNNIK